MPKNLEAKVSYLLEDIASFNNPDKIRAIVKFIETEMGILESRHEISFHSLQQINARAATILRDSPSDLEVSGKKMTDYPQLYRTLSYIMATYEYFRAEKLTPNLVGIKANKVI